MDFTNPTVLIGLIFCPSLGPLTHLPIRGSQAAITFDGENICDTTRNQRNHSNLSGAEILYETVCISLKYIFNENVSLKFEL